VRYDDRGQARERSGRVHRSLRTLKDWAGASVCCARCSVGAYICECIEEARFRGNDGLSLRRTRWLGLEKRHRRSARSQWYSFLKMLPAAAGRRGGTRVYRSRFCRSPAGNLTMRERSRFVGGRSRGAGVRATALSILVRRRRSARRVRWPTARQDACAGAR
jgi:hypothetical protein